VKLKDYHDHHYNPDRVLYPLRRSGPKGSRQFTRINWDEAIAEITSRWTAIIAKYGSQAIMPYSYLGNEGLVQGLAHHAEAGHRRRLRHAASRSLGWIYFNIGAERGSRHIAKSKDPVEWRALLIPISIFCSWAASFSPPWAMGLCWRSHSVLSR
jgi:hypothetical protein